MDIRHVHTTVIAVYAGHWYIKPDTQVKEWLEVMNRLLYHMNGIIIERLHTSLFIHVITGLSWGIVECMADGKYVTTDSAIGIFVDAHWDDVINLNYGVIQQMLPG